MPTPHIAALEGEFAEAILLPGDPLRARHIAEQHLDDAKQVTATRNMLGFTGRYQDMPVSVMGTGMGIPSAAIYVTELIDEYGVERLVRVGSCGGIPEGVEVRDVIVGLGACTDSATNRRRYGGWDFAAVADFGLAAATVDAAMHRDIPVRVGNLHSSDLFYNPEPDTVAVWDRMGVLGVEMEAAGLYGIAAEKGVRALAICTVSDHVQTGASLDAEQRETSFDDMVVLALDALHADAD